MNICAVIVTYNPNIEVVINLINNLKKQFLNIIIVDNNSENKKWKNLFKDDCYLIDLEENIGIAAAQNYGIKKAIELDAEKILFFDQDSIIDHLLVKKLINEFKILSKSNNIAAIGPRFIDESKGFYFPALKLNKLGLIDKFNVENIENPVEVSVLISSGTLVSVNALKEIGLMKEEFFIDFVDTEWCFRALSKRYKLYMSKDAVMKHSIGDDTIQLLNLKIPVHSGFRRYYRVRNLFYMWKMPYIPKALTFKLMISNFFHQILLLLLKDNKKDYIKYYFKAVKDGIKQSKDYHV